MILYINTNKTWLPHAKYSINILLIFNLLPIKFNIITPAYISCHLYELKKRKTKQMGVWWITSSDHQHLLKIFNSLPSIPRNSFAWAHIMIKKHTFTKKEKNPCSKIQSLHWCSRKPGFSTAHFLILTTQKNPILSTRKKDQERQREIKRPFSPHEQWRDLGKQNQ